MHAEEHHNLDLTTKKRSALLYILNQLGMLNLNSYVKLYEIQSYLPIMHVNIITTHQHSPSNILFSILKLNVSFTNSLVTFLSTLFSSRLFTCTIDTLSDNTICMPLLCVGLLYSMCRFLWRLRGSTER